MNLFGAPIPAPTAEHLAIAKISVVILSLLFVPYISILSGTVLFSLGFVYRGHKEERPFFLRFARDLVNTFIHWGSGIVLGILPVFTLMVCFAQILWGSEVAITRFFTWTLVFIAAAVILAQFYKKTFAAGEEESYLQYFLGLATLGALTLGGFAFVSTVTVATFPEKWPLITTFIPLTYDWNMLARFTHFTVAGLAMTGAAIVFFFINWMGGKEDLDAEYREYVRKFGGGVALGFGILQTLFYLWYLGTLPEFAKSWSVYHIGIAGIATLLLVSYLLYALLSKANTGLGVPVFILFLVFFFLVSYGENQARENALVYQNYALAKKAAEIEAEIEARRAEKAPGGGETADIAKGEEIYNTRCIACHRFDQRVVGPAYFDVLPKYKDNFDGLVEFILNPVRVNPEEFPAPMPNQGLSPAEAKAVASYLMKRLEEHEQQQ